MPETNDNSLNVQQDVTEARDKFEQARLSRRAALRKIGMTGGMALFGMFAVDDLARTAIRLMEKHQETKAIAEAVAKDFKNMGVAFADNGYYKLDLPPTYKEIGGTCDNNPKTYNGGGDCQQCVDNGCQQYYGPDNGLNSMHHKCVTDAQSACK